MKDEQSSIREFGTNYNVYQEKHSCKNTSQRLHISVAVDTSTSASQVAGPGHLTLPPGLPRHRAHATAIRVGHPDARLPLPRGPGPANGHDAPRRTCPPAQGNVTGLVGPRSTSEDGTGRGRRALVHRP